MSIKPEKIEKTVHFGATTTIFIIATMIADINFWAAFVIFAISTYLFEKWWRS